MEVGASILDVVQLAVAKVRETVSWVIWEYNEHPGRWNASHVAHDPSALPQDVVESYWKVRSVVLTYRVAITIPAEAPLQLRFLFRELPTMDVHRLSGRVVRCEDRLRLPEIAALLGMREELLFSSREYFIPLSPSERP